jgi:solute carrier family 25 phosphate transporter 3
LAKDLLTDLGVLYRVPYTVTKFVAFEKVSEIILGQFDKSTLSSSALTGINLGSGLMAGLAAAVVSQPADTMLSKINKTKGLPGESTISRLAKIARELGVRGSFAGLPTRLFMVGGLTAGQFAIYGDIKKALGMFMTVPHMSRSNIRLLTSL